MIYLKDFYLLSAGEEDAYITKIKRTCYGSFYPFNLFPDKHLSKIALSDITILYGGNGSGKSTILNIIATKIGADRVAPFNKSAFWDDYVSSCEEEYQNLAMANKRIITSDDVFDYMLDIRNLNEGIDNTREDRFKEYMEYKYSDFKFKSMDQIDELRRVNKARSKTQSQYVRETLMSNVREFSNGESAYRYFTENIDQDGIYILDEPENSLSPEMQMELIKFIRDSARFYGCQFIISTHSPFMLSMSEARVYDLDQDYVTQANWCKLKNVQTYYKFFKEHSKELEEARLELEE